MDKIFQFLNAEWRKMVQVYEMFLFEKDVY